MLVALLSVPAVSWGAKASSLAVRPNGPLAGQKAAWDLDNTLFDTRYRTQAAVRAFTKYSRNPLLKQAARLAKDIGNIGFDGDSTAQKLGLTGNDAKAFARHWLRFFWTAKNFSFDRLMPETIAALKEAHANGVETYYVTGRTRRSKSATLLQLREAGLPFADHKHLFMKKNIGIKTLPFKLETLGKIGVTFYGTDSPREVNALHDVGTKSVYVDFPVKHPASEQPTGVLRRIHIQH